MIKEIIKQITDARKANNKHPPFATFVEIQRIAMTYKISDTELRKQLNELYTNNEINVHKGLNDTLIELK
jgi:hypothetical protein